jgi:Cytochrome oxidase complex assembly protein 1
METRAEKPRRSWLREHWKLVLTVWLGLALSGGVAGLFLMSNSDAASLAVATAQSNPKMAERLGQPIKKGWFVSGSVEVTPASGHAELAIPLWAEGQRNSVCGSPKASGTVAFGDASVWDGRQHRKARPAANRRVTNDSRNPVRYSSVNSRAF